MATARLDAPAPPPLPLPDFRYWWQAAQYKQSVALALLLNGQARHALYGGAQGGGKTEVAMMLALAFCERRNARVLITSPSAKQLTAKGGIIQRLLEGIESKGLSGEAVQRKGSYEIYFSKYNAVIEYRIIAPVDDRDDAQTKVGSFFYDCIIVDEAGEINPDVLEYLPSRLGNPKSALHTAYLLTANPGGQANHWLRQRFVNAPQEPRSVFIPALVYDNPMGGSERIANLESLDGYLRALYLDGNFDAPTRLSLWTDTMLARARSANIPDLSEFAHIAIGVDPAGGGESQCGIVVCGLLNEPSPEGLGMLYVLGDYTTDDPPHIWVQTIHEVAEAYQTPNIVYERNFGARIGEDWLRNSAAAAAAAAGGIDSSLLVHGVWAQGKKHERAYPIVEMYNAGRVKHAPRPRLDNLESQMLSFTSASTKSADAIDALGLALKWLDGQAPMTAADAAALVNRINGIGEALGFAPDDNLSWRMMGFDAPTDD